MHTTPSHPLDMHRTAPQGYSKAMRLDAALKFTFLTGVFQVGLGLFRLGAIVHYVSYPVMVACNSAGGWGDTWLGRFDAGGGWMDWGVACLCVTVISMTD